MNLIPQKLHRKIEKALQIEKGCLHQQVKDLRKLGHSDEEIVNGAKGCLQWMQLYNESNFVSAFSLYIACLKNPREGGQHGLPAEH
jgi:hypothetical protein